jgi:ApbE superfamily uncharacterized protein (UPF0280 family)
MVRTRAQVRVLPDGRRLHLQDGPIDIVLQAFGAEGQVHRAHRRAADRFVTVLDELCSELPLLRAQVRLGGREPGGIIARRMFAAVMPYAEENFITPMAAVAGAVAEEILAAMTAVADLSRAYVNDGGDIALHIGSGEQFVIGMVELPDRPMLAQPVFGDMTLDSNQPVRGIATSGWRGRSFSLGIADAVTILAKTAAIADAAATIVANAVDLPGHPAISRIAARELSPDSDLGDRPVTTAVGKLTSAEVSEALGRGSACAERLIASGVIAAAALKLQGTTRVMTPLESPKMALSSGERSLAYA